MTEQLYTLRSRRYVRGRTIAACLPELLLIGDAIKQRAIFKYQDAEYGISADYWLELI